MGAQEATETSKASNKTSSAQETTPSMPGAYPEWMPGYYSPGPPFPPHLWSGQPVIIYPPGIYGHYGQFGVASPSSGNEAAVVTTDAEGKSENKGKRSRLRASKKGTTGSQSGAGESESDPSTNEEDEGKKAQNQEQTTDASSAFNLPLTPTKSAANWGDYWTPPGGNGAVVPPAKRPSASTTPTLPAPRDSTELDERELKRQRRKQSNRESARRSRQRKQAECEDLNHRVQSLTLENTNLRTELEKVRTEVKLLREQNELYKKQLSEKQTEQEQEQNEKPSEKGDDQLAEDVTV